MSKLRSVSTSFWSDPFIEELTPNQKLLFLYLITNSRTNMLGIYEASIKKISFETGLKIETVKNDLKEFERLKKVKYINNYVVLVNYMKHQNYNTNMKKSAIDIYNNLPNELKDNKLNITKDNPLKGFESLLNHYGMVRKIEYEYEEEREEESESEYDVKKSILDSQSWCEQIFMKRKINLDRGLIYLNTFLDTQEDLVGEGEGLNRSEHKIKNHFC